MSSIPPAYTTGQEFSLAYETARRRWPIIITQAIDDMYRSVSACEEGEKKTEGKKIIEDLARLKYELQHNRPMTPIPDDGGADIAGYNSQLEALGPASWMDISWLYSECYLYRRIHASFSLTTHWKDYDIFARQKINTFRSSRAAVVELAARYKDLITQLRTISGPEDFEKEKLLFIEMCEICLWGNATDLSLLTNLTYDDIQKLQGSQARKAAEKNILCNDLPKAFELLKAAKTSGKEKRRVDFVLDNAGFELFVDLVLAGYLLASGLATEVVLHPKSLPWFVSDVLPADFTALLDALKEAKPFYETASEDETRNEQTPPPLSAKDEEDLKFLYDDWNGLHTNGKISVKSNGYWTLPTHYWEITKNAPELAADLATSELVIFKGDLNYRKLTGDVMWDPTTPFETALQGIGPSSGINVLALRTAKADVVVSLAPGEDERVKELSGNSADDKARKWAWGGKWAVVSLSQGK